MARLRSPGYPNIGIEQALETVRKLYDKVRRNPIDREAAAKEIGYSGLTGPAAKMLSNLSHFGLIEKAGMGDLRVCELAVEALYGHPDSKRKRAIRTAAFSPELFKLIQERHSDGYVSEHALRNLLKREGFAEVAIAPAVNSYLSTYSYLQERGVAGDEKTYDDSDEDFAIERQPESPARDNNQQLVPIETTQRASHPSARASEIVQFENERVVFSEEAGPGKSLRLLARGELDAYLLEALDDYIKRQKRRLAADRRSIESEPPAK